MCIQKNKKTKQKTKTKNKIYISNTR